MEAMSGFLSFPIRRFCPARVEQEQAGGGGEYCWEEATLLNEIDQSPSNTTNPPLLLNSEEEEFVNSFFNMDYYDEKDNHKFPEEHKAFDHFHGELIENFSMMIEGDNELENMISTCFEDLRDVDSEMLQLPAREDDDDETHINISSIHGGVDQGLQLVHLLLACAEAVGCRDTQLADLMLTQIWPSISPWGDSLQRVSYCFAMGLKSRLSLLQNLNSNGTILFTANGSTDSVSNTVTREEKMEAFQLLHKTTPYIAFGFMAANDAITQASQGKDYLHIIDLGTQHTLQWPSLIRSLASRADGPPKSVRITAILENPCSLDLQSSIKGLIDEAGALGIPLEFHVITESVVTPCLLTKEKLNINLGEGEALFVNSIMHLHKYVKESRGSLKAILQAIKKLGPTLVTVVEQDSNHNGPFFLGRFVESLHYYSAIFDSLECSLPRNSQQRMKMEIVHFAEEIKNIIACEGSDRVERHERVDQWRRQLGRAGFQGVGLKCMSQARMMVSMYGCDGYTLASDKGCLLLGWKARPIMLASAWQLHN
ncbi:GRAS family protein RAD1-like [Actinidia eriantha]|uniref:GRAS family protein RAD1-like n=1 Tax=Actinidia eriantha TaxID=165200 RepID=UPI00258D79B7|nr:GRAS family protein RAD1-like [Actinidia eriantha]